MRSCNVGMFSPRAFRAELDQVVNEGILLYGDDEEAVVAYGESIRDDLVRLDSQAFCNL
jgi:hypothetical protein